MQASLCGLGRDLLGGDPERLGEGGIVRAALTYWSVLSAVLRNRPAPGHR